MKNQASKNKELSEQLAAWWRMQTDFETKKALAGFLKVHRDTIGDYFSGKIFPKLDIANRLYELTRITCLKPNASDGSSRGMVPQEPPPTPPLLEAKPGQLARGVKRGERNLEKPVVISLQRTSCPFCMQDVSRFRSCGYYGQSFVWANVPVIRGEPS